jgi:YVTN family beta-propeller protein
VSFVPDSGFAGVGGVMTAKIHEVPPGVRQPDRPTLPSALAHRVYVTSFLDGTLSTIDPLLNTVNASVPVGAGRSASSSIRRGRRLGHELHQRHRLPRRPVDEHRDRHDRGRHN